MFLLHQFSSKRRSAFYSIPIPIRALMNVAPFLKKVLSRNTSFEIVMKHRDKTPKDNELIDEYTLSRKNSRRKKNRG